MAIQSQNPATGIVEKQFDALTHSEIDDALARAAAAAPVMANASQSDRAEWLRRAAAILREEKSSLAIIMTREMGKTVASAEAEVEKCAWVCDFYADQGADFLKDRVIATDAKKSFVSYRPIGPVLAVMPWNYPLWQVFRFAAPIVMAGNVGLLKHASNVPQSALAIEDVLHRAGVPKDGFQTLLIGGRQVELLVKDSRLQALALTGSEGAGRVVAALAGQHLKKVVLELGGSDPFIVMPSADIDHAVKMAIAGRTLNNGQSCIAAKRFIVHRDIYTAFRDKFASRMEALKIGDPMSRDTDIGPLAKSAIRDELADHVERSLQKGAQRVVGAKMINGDGWFYQPGILESIPVDAPAYNEELFGPVASLFEVTSLEQAINLGNATRFGLGSAIFTNDEQEMAQAFEGLVAGSTFVNTITASDPRLPFGGVKASGYGRELAEEGIREFVNIKTCVIGGAG